MFHVKHSARPSSRTHAEEGFDDGKGTAGSWPAERLDHLHLADSRLEPMIRIRRTVLGSVRIRDGVAVAVCQARYVSVDSLFPAGPTLIAPAPCVVRQEAMRALGAFGVGAQRRPPARTSPARRRRYEPPPRHERPPPRRCEQLLPRLR